MSDAPSTAARPDSFFDRPAHDVARDLLGDVVVSTAGGRSTAGRIVETEAYVGPHDPASHAAERTGRTPRNAPMFGPPGTAYVYKIYGLHWCLNAVTGPVDFPAAVLIRALEPLDGLDTMQRRRTRTGRDGRDLARGPGRLTQALGVTGALDEHPLSQPPLRILPGPPVPDRRIRTGPRIGIRRAADWPLRFFLRDCRWVSG